MSGELQGRSFGGYQLGEQIGEGGVGEVYRARHSAAPGEVAVKVIFREFARQPGFAQTFAAVTQASTRLAKHAHVLPLIASGVEDEYYYLVSPYVREGSLAQWIAGGGRLGLTDVTPFFAQLCSALSYAHSLNVVHGNLKPSNIYLYEGRHVLVGDFGLLWDTRALDASWSGGGVEAFEFFAPEIFAGQMGPASDIYATGATLFATLAGHAPYHFDRLADLINAAGSGAPPSLAELGSTPPSLTPFDAVIHQAMAGRADDRFPSATMVSQAVESAVRQATAAQPPLARPVNAPQWQPLASTPMSAGTFNALPSPPGLFDPAPSRPAQAAEGPGLLSGAIPGHAPGAIPGAIAGAPLGLAQLAQLSPPFSPLPPMSPQDANMDVGAGPMRAAPAAGLTDQPTMRAPSAPIDPSRPSEMGLTPPTPLGPQQGFDQGFGQGFEPGSNGSQGPVLNRPMRDSQRMPAVGRTPTGPTPSVVPDPAANSGTFSPTELGLPRLTSPAMGNLPENWQALLTDDSARERHELFARSAAGVERPALDEDGDLMPLTGVFPQSDTKPRPAQSKRDVAASEPGVNAARPAPAGWAHSEPSRPWEAQAAESDHGAKPGDFGVSQPRSGQADYTIDGLAQQASMRARLDDTLHEQRAWTNSFRIVRARPHLSKNLPRITLLVAIILIEFIGIALARPDVCGTGACISVAQRAHQYAPWLALPGAQAPITLAPRAPTIATTSNGSATTALTITNIWSIPITWSAATQPAWVTVSPASGSIPASGQVTVHVTANARGLSPGEYVGAIGLNTSSGVAGAEVTLAVTPGPLLSATPGLLAFKACGDTHTIVIANTGKGTLTYSASPSQSAALTVSPASGSVEAGASANVTVSLLCPATAGQRSAVIIVSDGGSAQTSVTYNP